MLDKETIKSNPTLETLTDEQITVIETLSKNKEDEVISSNRKQWWDKLDADVAEVFGEEKPGGVKSHEHHKTWLQKIKSDASKAGQADEYRTKAEKLEAEKLELEKQIKSGSTDTALKSQVEAMELRLKDKEQELLTVKTTFETERNTLTEQLGKEKGQLTKLEMSHNFDKYLIENKIKLKASIPESILSEALENRKQSLIGTIKPDLIDDGKGGKQRVLRDETGNILRNPKNGLEPYTDGELFLTRIADLVDTGQSQNGAGTTEGKGSVKSTHLDLSQAKNQIQADDIIRRHIMTNEGIAKTSPKFVDRQKEIREENKVADLPLR